MAPVFQNVDYTTGVVWNTWTTTAATTDVVWTTWTYANSTGIDPWQGWATSTVYTITPEPVPALTPEQLAERKAEAERHQEQERVKRERAKQLLTDALAEAQREELKKDGYFHVETRDGTRRYRLSPGSAPRRVYGEDGRQWSYCIHPDYGYPPEDVVLAQKLLLETDEDAFLRIANASAVRVVA